MLKILLKRQLYELNRSFFYDPKKGKSRSKFASAAFIVLYALLMVCVLGGMFAFCAYQLANPLRAAGLDWLYFALFGTIGLMFGVFGSVFNTYAALYKANDNDLLLSLPVPVGSILLSRLLGVYLMGLMFSAVVFVPAAIVYLCIDFSVGTLLGCILGMLSISVFVFVLSCALGWVVAKIASKLKRKSFLTVIISLVFIGGYYYVVNNIPTLLMQFTQYTGAIGAGVKNFAYPVYLFGRMSAGNLVSAPLPVFGTAALALLTFYVMSKSFLKLATASSDTVTAKYNRNARQKASGVFSALLKRELGRFTASPAYMLNCGFGVIIMPIAGILLLIRGAALRSMLFELFDSSTGTIAILAAAAVCLVSTMNDMTAPSVSLEGKTLWILRSMPVTTQQILRAKLAMQLLLSGISVLFAAICTCIAFAVPIGSTIAVILACLSLVVLLAEFGLFLDLKKPNLNWTTEITPIKQSSSVMFALFGGWLYVLLFGAGWFLGAHALGAGLYLVLFFALNMILSAVLRSWLMRSGTDIFESL